MKPRQNAVLIPSPQTRLTQQPQSVELMDENGALLQIPYDLTYSFARHISSSKLTNMRRYTVGKVFRKNPAGGQPRDIYECDFDIVGPSQHRVVHVTETIRVMIEALNDFAPEIGPCIIRVNNYRILDSILSNVTPSDEVQEKVRRALGLYWKKVRTSLCPYEIPLTSPFRNLGSRSEGNSCKSKGYQ